MCLTLRFRPRGRNRASGKYHDQFLSCEDIPPPSQGKQEVDAAAPGAALEGPPQAPSQAQCDGWGQRDGTSSSHRGGLGTGTGHSDTKRRGHHLEKVEWIRRLLQKTRQADGGEIHMTRIQLHSCTSWEASSKLVAPIWPVYPSKWKLRGDTAASHKGKRQARWQIV